MCVGENCASPAVHYINAQLAALHENAVDCLEHHGTTQSGKAQPEYSYALAEFFFGECRSDNLMLHRPDMLFYAGFDKPWIEFECNHSAIFHLVIKQGHYHLDYTHTSLDEYVDDERFRLMSNIAVDFRICFEVREINGRDIKIGNGKDLNIRLVVLDLMNAQLVSDEVTDSDVLDIYLHKYLGFLQNSGTHVLFSLPDFVFTDESRLSINYLLHGTIPAVGDIRGITLDDINRRLASVWMKAALLVGSPLEQDEDRTSICLAEYRASWMLPGLDTDLHIKLGAPQVRAICHCSREVVFSFVLEEITFFDSVGITSRRYQGWEITVTVDIVDESDVNAARSKLDWTTVQIYRDRSTFPGLVHTDNVAVRDRDYVIDFIVTKYVHILERAHYPIVCFPISPLHTPSPPVSEDEVAAESDTEDVPSPSMEGLQITTIPPDSINKYFKYLYSDDNDMYTAARYTYGEFFVAEFKPMTLRLLSNRRAIIWVHLVGGYLKTLKDSKPDSESRQFSFKNWHFAFEVGLNTCSHADLPDVTSDWKARYAESAAFKQHGTCEDRYLKHIYLNLRNAEFLLEYSQIDDAFQSQDCPPINKIQAVLYYVTARYFIYLTEWGLNLLHTVVIWKTGTSPPPSGLTDVTLDVYPPDVSRDNFMQIPDTSEPMLIIFGWTMFQSPESSNPPQLPKNLTRMTNGGSYSTVSVTQGVQRLLKALAPINSTSTVVSLSSDVDNGMLKP
ncbi:hypothetical protein AcW1_000768 [Taiwanofungus camphoratus]|nr:hypothetical protein AcW1_000768 [Antrodia cinnamomea]